MKSVRMPMRPAVVMGGVLAFFYPASLMLCGEFKEAPTVPAGYGLYALGCPAPDALQDGNPR